MTPPPKTVPVPVDGITAELFDAFKYEAAALISQKILSRDDCEAIVGSFARIAADVLKQELSAAPAPSEGVANPKRAGYEIYCIDQACFIKRDFKCPDCDCHKELYDAPSAIPAVSAPASAESATPCTHDLAEQETACADGWCPICLRKELSTARADALEEAAKICDEISDRKFGQQHAAPGSFATASECAEAIRRAGEGAK